jgi:hypothetical protein
MSSQTLTGLRAGQSARVAGIAEASARLLLRLAMGAHGCGRARPSSSLEPASEVPAAHRGAVGGAGHTVAQSIVLARAAGSPGRPSRLIGCVNSCQWTLALRLVCRRISGAPGLQSRRWLWASAESPAAVPSRGSRTHGGRPPRPSRRRLAGVPALYCQCPVGPSLARPVTRTRLSP